MHLGNVHGFLTACMYVFCIWLTGVHVCFTNTAVSVNPPVRVQGAPHAHITDYGLPIAWRQPADEDV